MSNIKFILGECEEEMKKMIDKDIKIDKIITSPPYNILRPNEGYYDEYKDSQMTVDEYSDWTIRKFNLFEKLLNKNGCILYNMSYGTENTINMSLTIADIIRKTNFTLADIIVWKKKSASPNSVSSNKLTRIVEFIYIFCKKEEFKTFKTNKKITSYRKTGQKTYENLFNFIEAKNNDGKNELNKATFSTDLINKLFNIYVLPGDVILDPFGGTGTTAISSYINGNDCYSIELSEKQIEFSKNRLKITKKNLRDKIN